MSRNSPSKKWIALAHAVIVAGTVFGERSIDLVSEPQWIVALVHSCICAPRLVNVASADEYEILTLLLAKS
jgi:hypothetical protein